MVTRVRIEAEGSSTQEVEQTLQLAHEALDNVPPGLARRMMFGGGDEALVEAQAGELVIERCVRPNGAIFFRGRQVAHYALTEGAKLKGNRAEAYVDVHLDGRAITSAVVDATAGKQHESWRGHLR